VVSLQRCRELLAGEAEALSDREIEALREQLCVLARTCRPAKAELDGFRRALAALGEEERADVEERAAILEFDGKLSRDQAERLALSPYSSKLPKV
jgi:hypothetical protein